MTVAMSNHIGLRVLMVKAWSLSRVSFWFRCFQFFHVSMFPLFRIDIATFLSSMQAQEWFLSGTKGLILS